jgi:hypothetical protein
MLFMIPLLCGLMSVNADVQVQNDQVPFDRTQPQSQARESFANRYITADRTPWYVEAPGVPVKLAKLWGDRTVGEAGTLLTAPAGFHAGLHSHTADYWAVVVQGTWQHLVPSTGEGKGLRLEPGAFWTQKRTEPHDDWCISKTPCVILLFNKDPYVTEFPKGSVNVPANEIGWRKQDPNLPIEISLLWGDREREGGFGEFVQLPPGFNSGLHAHSGDFHAVLIKGTWLHVNETGQQAEVRLGPGSYVRQAGGGMHIDRCVSTEPCVLFLFQDTKADVIWPPGKK